MDVSGIIIQPLVFFLLELRHTVRLCEGCTASLPVASSWRHFNHIWYDFIFLILKTFAKLHDIPFSDHSAAV